MSLATLRRKSETGTAEAKASAENKSNDLFINLGFPVEIEGKETFVNLPLTLTADNLKEIIDKQLKSIGKNSTSQWVELINGRVAIAEAVMNVFDRLEAGKSILVDELDENDEEHGFLRNMTIQFVRRSPQEETAVNENVSKNIKTKFFNCKR